MSSLIIDDGNGVAVSLCSQLIKAGGKVSVIKPAWVKSTTKKNFDANAVVLELAEIDELAIQDFIAAQGQLDLVFSLSAKVAQKTMRFTDEAKSSVLLSFLTAKFSAIKASSAARPAFIAMTRQGGQFGFHDEQSGLVQGGISGLVKTLKQEWDNVFCRTLDLANKFSAEKCADILLAEYQAADTSHAEVGYDEDGRLTLSAVATDSFNLEQDATFNQDSVFLVSGGAKGVTAHCVVELAKKHQCQFILLGRSRFDANQPDWASGLTEQADLNKAAMAAITSEGEKPTPVAVKKIVP